MGASRPGITRFNPFGIQGSGCFDPACIFFRAIPSAKTFSCTDFKINFSLGQPSPPLYTYKQIFSAGK
jgi:hypothetical protein